MHPLEFVDPRRERLFRIFDERHAARGIRFMSGAASLSIGMMALQDALAGGAQVTTLLLWRLAMLAPMLGLFVLTFQRGGAGHWSTRLAWAASLLGAAEAGLLATATPAYRDLHSAGMFVIMALTVSGLRLRFPHAVAATGVQAAVYLAAMLLGGVDGPRFTYQLGLLAITATVSLLVARGHDQGRRRHFLEVLTLQASQAKLVRLGERLRKLSLSDELTGLPNRRELESRLQAALAAARRSRGAVTVAMVDLDRFKAINDTHGHAAGDVVLRQVAGVLARSLRTSDSVFRIGGDELCVLMPDTDVESGVEALQRSLDRLRAISQRSGLPVAFSAGCAEWCHGEERAAMLARADAALYRAKRAGGGRVHGAVTQALAAAS
jgi:diguanylate cyclase (GGDEF)-like protein